MEGGRDGVEGGRDEMDGNCHTVDYVQYSGKIWWGF